MIQVINAVINPVVHKKEYLNHQASVQSEFGVGYNGGYWQTVTVCQLEIIGRPFTKYVNALPILLGWHTPDAL